MLASPFTIDGIRVTVSVSVGIAIAPQDGSQEIMRRADLALYRMKSEGRNGYRFYEAEMDERIEARRALTADLRGALDRDEFILYFQPIVTAKECRVRGFEALLRWKHPVRGFVSPGEFIPLPEETGVIITLGEWILREACRIAAGWPGDGRIAVNLSPRQFRHSDLPQLVRSALRESGFAVERLELGITEIGAPGGHAGDQCHACTKLREMGVRLSLDDFGTGYSSLGYLRPSAVRQDQDRPELRPGPARRERCGRRSIAPIIDDGDASLDMAITAEGVETDAQRVCLLDQGCHEFQGYLFSKPLPAEQAAPWRRARNLLDRGPGGVSRRGAEGRPCRRVRGA